MPLDLEKKVAYRFACKKNVIFLLQTVYELKVLVRTNYLDSNECTRSRNALVNYSRRFIDILT